MYQTNSIEDFRHLAPGATAPVVAWNNRSLARVTRLRLLSDPGFPLWDVSYCWGQLKDGTHCWVQLPFDQLPKYRMRPTLVEYAQRDGVYAKGLGLLSPDVISLLV